MRLGKPGEGIESASTFHLNTSTSEVDASHFRLDCVTVTQFHSFEPLMPFSAS
jgi:hypothetical protein